MTTKTIFILNNIVLDRVNSPICIYKITSPNNKVYIGSTINFYRRICDYCNSYNIKSKKQPKLFNSFYKYNIENHKFEIIHTLEHKNIKELDFLERYYIDKYNTIQYGLNIRGGGRDTFNISQETKNKISKSLTGKKLKLSTRLKMSKARKNVPHPKICTYKSCKKILQYTLDNVFIRETTSLELKQEGYCDRKIRKNIWGITKHAYGYIWKYK